MSSTTTLLESGDNFQPWRKELVRNLGKDDCIEAVIHDLSHLQTMAIAATPYSSPPLAAEQGRRSAALNAVATAQRKAWSAIYYSLGTVPDSEVPPNLADIMKPEPKALFEHLEARWGAKTLRRQLDLFGQVGDFVVNDTDDPAPEFARLRKAIAELSSSSNLTIPQFLEGWGLSIVLKSLGTSYSSMASALLAKPDLKIEDVSKAMEAEWDRRKKAGLVVNEHGLLVKRAAVARAVPKQAGQTAPTGQVYCTMHGMGGHSTEQCKGKSPKEGKGRLSAEEWGKLSGPEKSAVRKARGFVAKEAEQDGDEEDVDPPSKPPGKAFAGVARQIAMNATLLSELALAAHIPSSAIIVDCGSTSPFIKDVDLLSNLIPCSPPVPIEVGDGKIIHASHEGRLAFEHVYYDRAYYVPDMVHNLLPTNRRGDKSAGLEWRIGQDTRLVSKDGQVLLRGKENPTGLIILDDVPVRHTSPIHLALTAQLEADKQDQRLLYWHTRINHEDQKEIWDLGVRGELDGRKWSGTFRRVQCIGCLHGKKRREPSTANPRRADGPLVNVSIDLWGPASTKSRLGHSYFLTTRDDYSGYISATPLKSKDEALEAFDKHVRLVENQLGRTIRTVRSDLGGEFMSRKFAAWCAERGIEHTTTPPDAHNQNARIERVHLTLLNDIRTNLYSSGLKHHHWTDTLGYSVYSRNRTPNSHGPAPITLFHEGDHSAHIDYAHMRPFGAKCVYRVSNQTSKLDPRGQSGILVGYGTGTTGYSILTEDRRVITSRDVTFLDGESEVQAGADEGIFGEAGEPGAVDQGELGRLGEGEDAPAVDLYEAYEPEEDVAAEAPATDEEEEDDESDVEPQRPRRMQGPGWAYEPDREGAPSPEPDPNNQPAQLYGPFNDWQNEWPEQPRRSNRLQAQGLLAQVGLQRAFPATPRLPVALHFALSASEVTTPQTYQQARTSGEWPQWKKAMEEHMEVLVDNNTWDVVEKLHSQSRALAGRWIYTRKIDGETGKSAEYKARYTVQGFMQRPGRDYGETWAAVAHKTSHRVFLSIVNRLDLQCDQMDVISAFLKSDIDKSIYISPPEGSDIPAGHVLHLNKSMFGLKQSPHLFNQKIDTFLKSLGFVPCKADPCIYYFNKGVRHMISLHVDDMLVASSDRVKLDELKAAIYAELGCKDQGPVSYFLGINVYRDRPNRKMYLSQEHYLTSLIARFGEVGNANKTPLPSDWQPAKATDEEHEAAKHHPYPALAGSVLYAATVTRPDLAYAASKLCQYISKWSLDHWRAAKHLLRYIKGTLDLCLTFDADAGKRLLLGYADADWGGCLDTRRSTTGLAFMYGGGAVAWKSELQKTVALSTTQAELMASTDAGKEAVWLRQLLADLEMGPADGEPVRILNDNMGAIHLGKHQHGFKINKHFDMRAQWIRENQDAKVIILEYVPTESNRADLMTKGLTAERTRQLRLLMNVRRRGEI